MRVKFNTNDMHCESCEMFIMDVLGELDGVQETKADHKQGVVEVDFDEFKVSAEAIQIVLEREGYKLEAD